MVIFLKRLIKRISEEKEKKNYNYEDSVSDYENEKQYFDQVEEINPFKILFDQYSDRILDMEHSKSQRYTMRKLKEINQKNKNNKEYVLMSQEDLNNFKEKIKNTTDSLDIIFTIKEMLLS